jgi:hypothetical protein
MGGLDQRHQPGGKRIPRNEVWPTRLTNWRTRFHMKRSTRLGGRSSVFLSAADLAGTTLTEPQALKSVTLEVHIFDPVYLRFEDQSDDCHYDETPRCEPRRRSNFLNFGQGHSRDSVATNSLLDSRDPLVLNHITSDISHQIEKSRTNGHRLLSFSNH